MRGNRTTKINAEGFNAFRSYNCPSLAHAGIHIKYERHLIRRPDPTRPFQPHFLMNNHVIILTLFPGIRKEYVESVCRLNGCGASSSRRLALAMHRETVAHQDSSRTRRPRRDHRQHHAVLSRCGGDATLRNGPATAASWRAQRTRQHRGRHGHENDVPPGTRLQMGKNHATHEREYRGRNHGVTNSAWQTQRKCARRIIDFSLYIPHAVYIIPYPLYIPHALYIIPYILYPLYIIPHILYHPHQLLPPTSMRHTIFPLLFLPHALSRRLPFFGSQRGRAIAPCHPPAHGTRRQFHPCRSARRLARRAPPANVCARPPLATRAKQSAGRHFGTHTAETRGGVFVRTRRPCSTTSRARSNSWP